MARRGSRLKRKSKGRTRLKGSPIAYVKIPIYGIPPREVLDRMELKPLDYSKFTRTKNGGK